MPEWSNRAFSKTVVGASPTSVRIHVTLLAQQADFFARAFIFFLNVFVRAVHQITVLMLLNPFVQRRDSSVYLVAFIANIARKRAELNRGKSTNVVSGRERNIFYSVEIH
ncbi:hypothetical protein DS901_09450 [Loktanella sp. D2R18]|nr:hypothetical protein DS901_09450 [Loktanella sp. D2R18]